MIKSCEMSVHTRRACRGEARLNAALGLRLVGTVSRRAVGADAPGQPVDGREVHGAYLRVTDVSKAQHCNCSSAHMHKFNRPLA